MFFCWFPTPEGRSYSVWTGVQQTHPSLSTIVQHLTEFFSKRKWKVKNCMCHCHSRKKQTQSKLMWYRCHQTKIFWQKKPFQQLFSKISKTTLPSLKDGAIDITLIYSRPFKKVMTHIIWWLCKRHIHIQNKSYQWQVLSGLLSDFWAPRYKWSKGITSYHTKSNQQTSSLSQRTQKFCNSPIH